MSDRPCLSIVIPVYNVEDYLDRCLSSVISASGIQMTEIILVDDGSTDKSGRIADSYADQYEYIESFHKTNGGLSDARNYGLEKAKGKYVVFIDSDDMVVPDGLDRVYTEETSLLKVTCFLKKEYCTRMSCGLLKCFFVPKLSNIFRIWFIDTGFTGVR